MFFSSFRVEKEISAIAEASPVHGTPSCLPQAQLGQPTNPNSAIAPSDALKTAGTPGAGPTGELGRTITSYEPTASYAEIWGSIYATAANGSVDDGNGLQLSRLPEFGHFRQLDRAAQLPSSRIRDLPLNVHRRLSNQ